MKAMGVDRWVLECDKCGPFNQIDVIPALKDLVTALLTTAAAAHRLEECGGGVSARPAKEFFSCVNLRLEVEDVKRRQG